MNPRRLRVRTKLAVQFTGVFLGVAGLYIVVNFGLGDRDTSGLIEAAVGVAVITAVAVVAGWLIAERALRPLRRITATAQRISATNLGERIALDGPEDELRELADTIDALLDRLQASFARERQFVANASHELRTPLAVTRTALELSPDDPSAEERMRQALRATARSETLVNDLLLLARSETLDPGGWEAFDLAELVDEVVSHLAVPAEDAAIEVPRDLQPTPMLGHPGLVDRLVANLVDNAIRHNLPQGWVEVRTWSEGSSARLRVTNTCLAPATPVDELFEPFQRGAGRADGRQPTGHGLGLSIVRAIAESHHGEIRLALFTEPSRFQIDVTFPPPL